MQGSYTATLKFLATSYIDSTIYGSINIYEYYVYNSNI